MSSERSDQPPALSSASVTSVEGLEKSPSEIVTLNASCNDRSSPDRFSSARPQSSSHYEAVLTPLDTTSAQIHPTIASPHIATPISAGLRIQTDHLAEKTRNVQEVKNDKASSNDVAQQTVYNAGLPVRTSSIRSVYGSRPQRTDSLSPGSVMSSPGVGPLVDMTPLPSPISVWGSPKLWRASTIDSETDDSTNVDLPREPFGSSPQFTHFSRIPSKKRKVPALAAGPSSQEVHSYNVESANPNQNRSISDYLPDGLPVPKPRNVVASTSNASHLIQALSPPDDVMHREQYLAVERGLAISKPPTPPDSNCESDNLEQDVHQRPARPSVTSEAIVYEARTLRQGQMKRWQTLRRLGKGEFSAVYLATSEFHSIDGQGDFGSRESNVKSSSLVAIKVAEHGPAGGADEQKVQTSIRREVDLMKSINHPSIVHLIAVNEYDRQTIIVENYCAGGDLFDLASQNLQLLTPPLIRRIFAELVAAVRYLHLQYIVHRDIKLENVLVNLPTIAIMTLPDWQLYASPVITLTDLGLGRWIPQPPASPMLTTRCGSEDYAAPEVLLGDEYDGRSTDAWALGVLLYAIMEGRLPFDAIPGSRKKTPTSHKIARCDWQWLRYADENAEWDAIKGRDLQEAANIVQGLVAKRRSRWTLEKVGEIPWVLGGIEVQGGLRGHDELDNE